MELLIQYVSSPGTFVVILVVGILSSYMKDAINKVISTISVSWRDRVKRRNDKDNELVEKITGDIEMIMFFGFEEIRLRGEGIFIFIMSFIIMFLNLYAWQLLVDGGFPNKANITIVVGDVLYILGLIIARRRFSMANRIRVILYLATSAPRNFI